jgi:hypothetical protein
MKVLLCSLLICVFFDAAIANVLGEGMGKRCSYLLALVDEDQALAVIDRIEPAEDIFIFDVPPYEYGRRAVDAIRGIFQPCLSG